MKQSLTIIAFAACLGPQSSYARLTSLSSSETVNVQGQNQQHVLANCGTKKHKPLLIKKANREQWCDSVLVDICHKDKFEVGQRVCSLSYSNRLKSEKRTPSSTAKAEPSHRNELIREAMNIEAALIEIQAARIKLRKRELALIKQRDRDILQASR